MVSHNIDKKSLFFVKFLWWGSLLLTIGIIIHFVLLHLKLDEHSILVVFAIWILWTILFPILYISVNFVDNKKVSLSMVSLFMSLGVVTPMILWMTTSWWFLYISTGSFIIILAITGYLMIFRKKS